jgi:hypothetical protein
MEMGAAAELGAAFGEQTLPTTETPRLCCHSAYNTSQFIVETVESVLRQTFIDFSC